MPAVLIVLFKQLDFIKTIIFNISKVLSEIDIIYMNRHFFFSFMFPPIL